MTTTPPARTDVPGEPSPHVEAPPALPIYRVTPDAPPWHAGRRSAAGLVVGAVLGATVLSWFGLVLGAAVGLGVGLLLDNGRDAR